jgi:hypothetical protein
MARILASTVEWPSPREGKRYVLLDLGQGTGGGGEGEINLCVDDERENPRGVRDHLDMSAFGLVTGEVL